MDERMELQQRASAGAAPLRALRASGTAQRGGVSVSDSSLSSSAPASAATQVYAPARPSAQAWVVVAASSLFFFVTLGLVYSFGVTQRTLILRGFASASQLGWVSAVTVIYAPLLSIPLQLAVQRWGNRAMGLAGALLTGSGYVATSFCFTTPGRLAPLFVAQSVFGLGYAFVFWSCNSLAAEWFPAGRVGLAVGIVYAGSGVGGAVFSLVLDVLIAHVGLENALRAYGAFALLALVPASALLRPGPQKQARMRAQRERERLLRAEGQAGGQQQQRRRGGALRTAMDWRLARDRKFFFLFTATSLVTFSLFVPPFFLPTYAASAGFSARTGARLAAGYNLSSALGRVAFGVLADRALGPVTTLTLCILLFGASILTVWILAAGALAPLVLFMLLNGAAGGALLSLQPAVTASVWRPPPEEDAGAGADAGADAGSAPASGRSTSTSSSSSGATAAQSVLAMSTSGRVFGSLLGAPLAGYLLDAFGGAGFGTGAYRPALLVVGCIALLAGASLAGLRWCVAGFEVKKRV